MSDPQDIEPTADLRSRANLCVFLAHLYRRELTQGKVERLSERGLFEQLEQHGYALQRERLGDADHLARLRHEYARIFVGPGPHVSPYGSVHHPDDPRRGQLWGETSKWVRRFVKDHGMSFEGEGYDGIPDHIGHELEFYGHLLEAERRAWEEGEDTRIERLQESQRKFLTAQLARWIPAFCEAVREADQMRFYAEVARLTADLVRVEEARLDRAVARSAD